MCYPKLRYHMTTLVTQVNDIKNYLVNSKRELALVPTMGSLHAGHISLIKAARYDSKTVVVYIFINPLQFGPHEDFNIYPRDLDNDLKICEENNVDFVFAPGEKEIYPEKNIEQYIIHPPENLASDLCGRTRKSFFNGIATVLKRFFDIIQPDLAYFGEKDLQQMYVVRWLIMQYAMPIFLKPCPIIREENGLACSSRNVFLSSKEKAIASNIYKSLLLARKNIKSGIFTVSKAILESLVFLSQFPGIKVEYLEARDKNTFSKVDEDRTKGFYYLIAARVGNVRLIDNIEI